MHREQPARWGCGKPAPGGVCDRTHTVAQLNQGARRGNLDIPWATLRPQTMPGRMFVDPPEPIAFRVIRKLEKAG